MSKETTRASVATEKKLRNLKPYKPGQSGNPKGRPKGARNRLGTAFLEALEGDFNRFGSQAIAQVREKKPEVYMRVVADLLPKEANINVDAGEAFVELWRRISDGLGDELVDRFDEAASVEEALMSTPWQRAWLKSKDNPLIFVRDVLGATPEPWQAEALEAIGRHDRVSIRSGHGVGKTSLHAWLVLWFLLTRKNCKVPVAANSQDQLRDTIWPEIAKWHRQLPEALKAMIDVQAERVVVVQDPEGAFAVRRTASKDNPEALQGFHAEHLLFLIDEASGIPDVVFEVGMGALSTPGAKVVMAGNPTRSSGFFYDTHHSLRHRWHTMHVSCLDVPRAQGHIEDIRAKYGDNSNAWRVRVLGEFPTADDETVIPLDLVLSAVGRNVSSQSYCPVWGVDVARFGDDRTAIAKRQANHLLEPIKVLVGHGPDGHRRKDQSRI